MVTRILSNLHLSRLHGSDNHPIDVHISGNRIESIRNHQRMDASGRHAASIPCHGTWITQGFCDSHIHLIGYSLSRSLIHLDRLSLRAIRNVMVNAVSNRNPGDWIRGRGWEMNLWDDPSVGTAGFLDLIAPVNPVALISKDGHSVWLNRIAMERIDLAKDLPDPPGGRFERDPSTGDLTGFMRENAADMVLQRLPKATDQEILQSIDGGIQTLVESGIISIHAFENLRNLRLILDYLHARKKNMNIRFYVESGEFDAVDLLFSSEEDLPSGVCWGGVKMFADGALGSRTAAVTTPYHGEPDNFGIQVTTVKEIADTGIRAALRHRDVSVHAIGDLALRNTLDAFEPIRERFPSVPLRIEHIQLAQFSDLERMKSMGVIASVQPSHMISDREMAQRLWQGQSGFQYPYGTIERLGIAMRFGSDAPIEPPDPLTGIRAAVHRMDFSNSEGNSGWIPQEAMSLVGAIDSSCKTDPFDITEPDGKVRIGGLANLVLWDNDPAEYINGCGVRPQVLLAMSNGEIILNRMTSEMK